MSHGNSNPAEALPADRSSALTDLIAVAEGAVVSRVLAKSGGGNVTLFAFDTNQGLSEHTAPFDAMVEILDGEAEITISGKARKVKAGEFIIMPAHEPHSLRSVKKYKMALIMIRS